MQTQDGADQERDDHRTRGEMSYGTATRCRPGYYPKKELSLLIVPGPKPFGPKHYGGGEKRGVNGGAPGFGPAGGLPTLRLSNPTFWPEQPSLPS